MGINICPRAALSSEDMQKQLLLITAALFVLVAELLVFSMVLTYVVLNCYKRSFYHLLQRLEKQLESERHVAARHAEEIETLRQTIKQLTTALAQGSNTASADAKVTWAEIVSENHRLRSDKSSLLYRLNDTQTSLSEENKQLSKMVRVFCCILKQYNTFLCVYNINVNMNVSFTSR